eukprot:5300434-Prymnesium_polylepis.1
MSAICAFSAPTSPRSSSAASRSSLADRCRLSTSCATRATAACAPSASDCWSSAKNSFSCTALHTCLRKS